MGHDLKKIHGPLWAVDLSKATGVHFQTQSRLEKRTIHELKAASIPHLSLPRRAHSGPHLTSGPLWTVDGPSRLVSWSLGHEVVRQALQECYRVLNYAFFWI